MRAFVALDIPDEDVLDELVSLQRELAATGADLKLVERENLHFTLKFLGEISETQASEASRKLGSLALSKQTVAVGGVGAFPTVSRPNVVWVGVADEERVGLIAQPVLGALDGIGERDTRPFRAHLTVARVRSGRNNKQLESFLRTCAGRQFGEANFTAFRLKSSTLTPAGPIYRDLGVFGLK